MTTRTQTERGSRQDGDATRKRILDASERLFAARGIDAVSTREIMRATKTNASGIVYHFGTKDDLVRALIVDRRARFSSPEAHTNRLESATNPTVADIATFLLAPLVDVSKRAGGRTTLRFLGRVIEHPQYSAFYLSLFDLNTPYDYSKKYFPDLDPAQHVLWMLFTTTLAQRVLMQDNAVATVFPAKTTGDTDRLDPLTELSDFVQSALSQHYQADRSSN